MKDLVKHWYIPLIIGIFFVLFGLYVFTVPLATYVTLAIFFSVSFLVSGVFEIVFSLQNQKALSGWGWYLVSGLISAGLGIYLMIYPGISMSVLPFFVGFTLLFRSTYLLGFSFDLKSMGVSGWGTVAFTSVVCIIASFLMLYDPMATGLSLSILTGVAFVFAGIAAIVLSMNLKKIENKIE